MRKIMKKTVIAILVASSIVNATQAETVTQARIATPQYSTYIGQGYNTAGAGQHNTGIGHNAMPKASSSFNTAVGSHALFSLTSGQYNTASGLGALQSLTTGSQNTAMGQGAMVKATNSSSNTAMGWSAMYSNTTGSNNVAIGRDAANYLTTGSNNVAIGGGVAGPSLTTGSNNIVIGSDARLTNATGSYQLNIGNLIRGIMSGTKSVTVDGTFAANSLSSAAGIAGQSLSVTGAGSFGSLTSSGLVSAGTLNVTGATNLGNGATINSGNLQVSAGNVSARIGNFTSGLNVGDIAQVDKAIMLKNLYSAPVKKAEYGTLYANGAGEKLSYIDGNGGTADVMLVERASLNDLRDASITQAGIFIGDNDTTSPYGPTHGNDISIGFNSYRSPNNKPIFPGDYNTVPDYSTVSGGNIALGSNSLKRLTTDSTPFHNVAVGNGSLAFLTSGSFNTVIGASAGGFSLRNGSRNILIGANATPWKNVNESASNQLSIGNLIYGVMEASGDNGPRQVLIENAKLITNGDALVKGTLAIRGGSPAAGKVLTSDASGNASWQAVPAATVAPNSVDSSKIADWSITGSDIGISTITGTNIANGSVTTWDLADTSVTNAKIVSVDASKITGTLSPAQTGLSNIIMKDQSLYIGTKSGEKHTTSSPYNVALGDYALAAGVTTRFNTAIGSGALRSATTGDSNVALGSASLQSLTRGNHNIAIGPGAMSEADGVTENIAIGPSSLIGIKSGTHNIVIGHSAGGFVTGTNNILIGSGTTPHKVTNFDANDQLNIGNLILGTMGSAFTGSQTRQVVIQNANFVVNGDTMRIRPKSTPPAFPYMGSVYMDDSGVMCVYNGTSWDKVGAGKAGSSCS